MKYVYPAIFKPSDVGGYEVYFPDVRMGGTQGSDMVEAMEMAVDFLSSALYDIENKGCGMPNPSKIGDIETHEGDLVTFVYADTSEYRRFVENRVIKKTLTIPSWLNAKAEAANVNFSQTLQRALKSELHITE